MATLVTRLTNTGNLLVNGTFDEITLTANNSNAAYSVSSDTVFSKQFDEVSLAAGSMNFDGSSYVLVNTTNDTGNIGTQDFTWEAWVYPINFSADRVIFDGRDGAGQNTLNIRLLSSTGVFRLGLSGASITIDGSAVQANAWTHLAITRSGTLLNLIQNGVITNTVINSTSLLNYNNRPIIGASGFTLGNASFLGYISNVRLIKGDAFYTTGFTPAQTVLDSTANTSLLFNVLNSIDFRKDNGPYNFVTTVSGTPTWSSFGPFNQNVTGLVERRLANVTIVKDQFDEFTGVPIVDSSLAVWLDAANPASYPETGTTLTDLSGNGRTLTLFNSPTFVSTDPSLEFNGSTQYGSFSVPAMTNYSLGFWLYIISLPASGEEQIFGSPSDTASISLLFSGGAWKWHSWAGISRVGNAVSTGQWYNFVMTRTGSSTIFYVNGSSSSTFASGANINAGTAYLYEVSGVGGRNLNARFSNLQIYNRVLSADEISQNFNAMRRRFSI